MSIKIETDDCLPFFRRQPDGAFDCVFGSPPYEDARLYLEDGRNLGIARKRAEWVEWMVEVTKQAMRCCKGPVFWVCQGKTRNYKWSASPIHLMAKLDDLGFDLRCPPIFHRVGIPGSGGRNAQHSEEGGSADWLRNDYEFIITVTHGGKLPWGDTLAMGHAPKWAPGGEISSRLPDGRRVNDRDEWGGTEHSQRGRNPDGTMKPRRSTRGKKNGDTVDEDSYLPPAVANPGNVLKYAVGGGLMGHDIAHKNEAPFPEGLAEFFVRCFCKPGGIVCDPFSGSGTTAAVCAKNGRHFHGCDLRASQVKWASVRIGSITPTSLFDEGVQQEGSDSHAPQADSRCAQ